MEKKIILEFLDTHWEEFIAFLTGNRSDMVIPREIREFAALVGKLTVNSNSTSVHSAGFSGKSEVSGADTSTEAAQAYTKDGDSKGLLEKAQTFRRTSAHSSSDGFHSIISENGLFLVQKETKPNSLDPVFKKLVDSVL